MFLRGTAGSSLLGDTNLWSAHPPSQRVNNSWKQEHFWWQPPCRQLANKGNTGWKSCSPSVLHRNPHYLNRDGKIHSRYLDRLIYYYSFSSKKTQKNFGGFGLKNIYKEPGQFIIPILSLSCRIRTSPFHLSFGAITFILHSHRNCCINMKFDFNLLKPHNSSHVKDLIIFSWTRASLWTLLSVSCPGTVGWAVLGHGENPEVWALSWTPADTRVWLLPSWYKAQQMVGFCGIHNPREAKLRLWEDHLRISGCDIRSEEHKPAPNLPSEQLNQAESWLNVRWCLIYSQTLLPCSTNATNE